MDNHNSHFEEVTPPWVEYPEFPPYDTFWRQSGQDWLKHAWEPFWFSMDEEAQEAYLSKWKVPKKWQDFYFDAGFEQLLEDIDQEE